MSYMKHIQTRWGR